VLKYSSRNDGTKRKGRDVISVRNHSHGEAQQQEAGKEQHVKAVVGHSVSPKVWRIRSMLKEVMRLVA
jgi:hypothetical protein